MLIQVSGKECPNCSYYRDIPITNHETQSIDNITGWYKESDSKGSYLIPCDHYVDIGDEYVLKHAIATKKEELSDLKKHYNKLMKIKVKYLGCVHANTKDLNERDNQ